MNLAVLNSDKAEKVINNYPEIDKWVIGGHSLGGVMACKYAPENDKGNHGHFGDYGEQKGDGTSTITSKEQWDETAKYTIDFLDNINQLQ